MIDCYKADSFEKQVNDLCMPQIIALTYFSASDDVSFSFFSYQALNTMATDILHPHVFCCSLYLLTDSSFHSPTFQNQQICTDSLPICHELTLPSMSSVCQVICKDDLLDQDKGCYNPIIIQVFTANANVIRKKY